MTIRLAPRSLAARTAWILLLGLMIVQAAGLSIDAFDRLDLQRLGQAREVANGVIGLYRTVVLTPPEDRGKLLADVQKPSGIAARLEDTPPTDMTLAPIAVARLLRADMSMVQLPPGLRPRQVLMLGDFSDHVVVVGMRLPEGAWLNVRAQVPSLYVWSSPGFPIAFVAMTITAALLIVWGVRRLLQPVLLLADAAERLGRDVNSPALPETGPTEVAGAAAAFNLMAERIRRFVSDRTFLLTAIGHDLRTPITRLKLRCEFVEDEEMRRRMLGDLDELETMVNATLAFGRDVAASEPIGAVDLAALVRTVLDEAGDARPELADHITYAGPEHLTVQSRSLSIKRALGNLIGNALTYGGNARVSLEPPPNHGQNIRIVVEDDGPGIPPDELSRVFDPFYRAEASRNRETGGVGLGLPIARNILRAHGGDVTLANRSDGGTRATVVLPA